MTSLLTDLAVADDPGTLYRLIAETIPLKVWTASAEGRVDFVNQRVLEFTGAGAAALAGWDGKIFVHPEDREPCAALWTRALQSGERYEAEYRLRRADGVYRWHHDSAVALRGGQSSAVRWFGFCTDIEDQVRSAQLLENERRFKAFMDHLPAMAWIRDAQGRYAYVNRAYERTHGVSAAAVVGREAADFYPPQVVQRFRETDAQVRREGAGLQYVEDWQGSHVHGGRWLKVKFPFPDAGGAAGVAGISLDITQQSRLEEALRSSEQRFRSFMDHSPAIAWIRDAELRYTYVNRPYEIAFGRKFEDVVGRDVYAFYPRELAEEFLETDRQVQREGRPLQVVSRARRADGEDGNWLFSKFPLPDGQGGVGVGGIGMEISERIKAEERAGRYAADIRDLMNRLIAAQESERRRLAVELHDLIGQNLTAIGIELSTLKARLSAESRSVIAPRAEAIGALLDSTIDAIRGVMTELRPPALEEYGLVPALRWYASVFSERTGMKAAVEVIGTEARLPRETELALFRIVQEALTNAAKHSGGSAVRMLIEYAECIRLVVEDDGKGFADPVGARGARRGGWGLPAMRERAEAHGGRLRIEFPDRGTQLIVEIPAHDAD